jgi:sugar phosphate permease
MTYYLTLFYPPSRIGKRIGQYFTAAQVSAAVVGLVSAGFQEMDGARGYVGFQWMFLIYGVITIALGFAQLWWLPDRPVAPGASAPERHRLLRWLPQSRPALTGRDSVIHYHDMKRVYHSSKWNLRDLLYVFMDWRLWPLLVMYFGVVGVGIGVQLYANVIIKAINPSLNGVDLSLLTAPIWIVGSPSVINFPFHWLNISLSRWISSLFSLLPPSRIVSTATALCSSRSLSCYRFLDYC